MDILTELNRIVDAKDDLADAIEEKGVEVPDGVGIENYPDLVRSISGSSIIESGQCGENVYWELYKNGLLVISGSGATFDVVVGSPSSPFRNRTDITDVVIKEGVTTIGEALFGACSVENIIIPSSIESIGEDAFSNCKSLKSIVIPSGCATIGALAFVLCRNLSRVVIPDSVTSIGEGAFLETSGEYAQLEILYAGTKEQWDNVTIGENNDRILNGTLHCEYDSNADTLDGWHLDVRSDGYVPPASTRNTFTIVYSTGG